MNTFDTQIHLIAEEFYEKYGSSAQLEAVKLLAQHAHDSSEHKKWMQVADILSERVFMGKLFGSMN